MGDAMERVNMIWKNKVYQESLRLIELCEKDRIYCRHDMAHFLDVARLAVIISLKEQIEAEEEVIYAASLLHDIGRHKQYTEEIPHQEASVPIAAYILKECCFSEEEISIIIEAIAGHRDRTVRMERSLRGLLYRADKASRACFACAAESACDWKSDKKNMALTQ